MAPDSPLTESDLQLAVEQLAADHPVAVPTETVWGLAARARSDAALEAVRRFKGRSENQPISVFVSGAGDLDALGFRPSAEATALMDAFWPGPLTLVLPVVGAPFARGVARESDGAVGVRCSPHPVLQALVRACAEGGLGPLTATSLNRSGEPPATTRAEASALCLAALEGPTVLPAGPLPGPQAKPSTVIDCVVDPPQILREGAISRDVLDRAISQRMQKEELE